VRHLGGRRIAAGERWIYVAGCNTTVDAPGSRVDAEVADMARIADNGGRVAILSHQGSWRDGSAAPLDWLARCLQARLGRTVRYVLECASSSAVDQAAALGDGEVAVFGNTRMAPGEERNDPELADWFARLGDVVAIGGFSKAHRAHASNVGVLAVRPAVAADCL